MRLFGQSKMQPLQKMFYHRIVLSLNSCHICHLHFGNSHFGLLGTLERKKKKTFMTLRQFGAIYFNTNCHFINKNFNFPD